MYNRVDPDELKDLDYGELVAFKQFLGRVGGTEDELKAVTEEIKARHEMDVSTGDPDYHDWELSEIRGRFGR